MKRFRPQPRRTGPVALGLAAAVYTYPPVATASGIDPPLAFCRPTKAIAAAPEGACICSANGVEVSLTHAWYVSHLRHLFAGGAIVTAELDTAVAEAASVCAVIPIPAMGRDPTPSMPPRSGSEGALRAAQARPGKAER